MLVAVKNTQVRAEKKEGGGVAATEHIVRGAGLTRTLALDLTSSAWASVCPSTFSSRDTSSSVFSAALRLVVFVFCGSRFVVRGPRNGARGSSASQANGGVSPRDQTEQTRFKSRTSHGSSRTKNVVRPRAGEGPPRNAQEARRSDHTGSKDKARATQQSAIRDQ